MDRVTPTSLRRKIYKCLRFWRLCDCSPWGPQLTFRLAFLQSFVGSQWVLGGPSADPRRTLGGPSADPRRTLGGPLADLGGPSADRLWTFGRPSVNPRLILGKPSSLGGSRWALHWRLIVISLGHILLKVFRFRFLWSVFC